MEIYYEYGIHIVSKTIGIHILCDPASTKSNSEKQNKEIPKEKELANIKKAYEAVNIIFVSHGHADHIDLLSNFANTKIPVYAHPMTISFKNTNFIDIIYKQIKEGEMIKLNQLNVKAYPSGHCGGSLMYLFELEGKKILFTGDLNMENTYATSRPSHVICDVLIMEATFGKKEYKLPSRESIYKDIELFINQKFNENKKNIILYGHGLGKIQDIVKFLNSKNINSLYLDAYSYQINQIYDVNYKKLGTYNKLSNYWIIPEKSILCLSMHLGYNTKSIIDIMQEFGLNPDTPIAYLSGWGNDDNTEKANEDKTDIEKELDEIKENFNDVSFFPLSSHSGYDQLLYFVDACECSKTCLFHGFSKDFALSLSTLGYNAIDIHTSKLTF